VVHWYIKIFELIDLRSRIAQIAQAHGVDFLCRDDLNPLQRRVAEFI